MPHKGHSGGSLGGRIVHTRKTKRKPPPEKKPYEKNEELCPVCNAVPGAPCRRVAAEKLGQGLRPRTHRSTAQEDARKGIRY